jgi:hypothetical protein
VRVVLLHFASMLSFVVLCCALSICVAQDPASSWLCYAVARSPDGSSVSRVSARTTIPLQPPSDPNGEPAWWFGIEPKDNLFLIQPIVPKWLGDGYYVFSEGETLTQ